MAEEEVHGGVEVRVQPDEQDDEQVAQHCGQVHAQEQGEEHALLLWLDRKTQEEELGHMALVLRPHALLISAGNIRNLDILSIAITIPYQYLPVAVSIYRQISLYFAHTLRLIKSGDNNENMIYLNTDIFI